MMVHSIAEQAKRFLSGEEKWTPRSDFPDRRRVAGEKDEEILEEEVGVEERK